MQAGGIQMSESKSAQPVINVTPLIDVLLVLLIIFMVAAPLKPHRFMTNLPASPQDLAHVEPNPLTLVVTIQPDRTLKLNQDADMGTIDEPAPLLSKLNWVFAERVRNHT